MSRTCAPQTMAFHGGMNLFRWTGGRSIGNCVDLASRLSRVGVYSPPELPYIVISPAIVVDAEVGASVGVGGFAPLLPSALSRGRTLDL